ncbi:MAG TPA: cyclic peptide export ABC transporter, partial [Longimicrobium sp.]|nr:cyclic peptide export ABC transporter [Longimicrobium sp.]
MKLLAFLLRNSPRAVLVAIAAGVVSGLAHTALLALINRALHEPASNALVPAFVTVLLALPLLRMASTYVLTMLGQRAVMTLRMQLSRAILDAPLGRLEALGAHRLLATINDDAGAIVAALRMVPAVLADFAIVVGGLAYLWWLSVPVFLLFLACLLVGVATYQYPLAKGASFQRKVRAEADRLWEDLRGVIDGMKELKLHTGRREALLRRMDDTGHRARRLSLRAVLYFHAAAGWGQVLVFGMIGLILFARPGGGTLDAQALTGYVLVILYLTGPIEALMNSFPALNAAQVAMDRVKEVGITLEAAAPAAAAGAPLLLPAAHEGEALELVDVAHRYGDQGGDSPFSLGPLGLRVEPGELVFITGGNGSGKTTLAKVLAGLYAPASGQVRIGGRLVTDENRREFLDRFTVVFSDFYLFESLLGLEGETLDERAREWLRKLQLDDKVKVENGRFSTTALSRGQRKRLALLTAYLEDRPIYIFDEWAADQDPQFKQVFYRELLPELAARGKAVVVISHDDRYFDAAHRLVKLDYGRIVPVERDAGPAALPAAVPAGLAALPVVAG